LKQAEEGGGGEDSSSAWEKLGAIILWRLIEHARGDRARKRKGETEKGGCMS